MQDGDTVTGPDPAARHLTSTYATGAGIIAILLWSALALLTASTHGIPPFELLALSFGVAFLGGIVVLAVQGQGALKQLVQPPAAWFTAFAGIFGYHALYFFALSAAPPAEASLICFLWPLLIVVFAALLPGEHLRPRHLGGAVLGLGGTVLLLANRLSAAGSGELTGYLAALGCAFVWSGYSVFNRRFAKASSAMVIGVCGAVALAGALCHLVIEATVPPSPLQWASILALGIGPTGFAFLAWDYATKHGRLSLLGVLSYLAPLVSTLLLILFGRTAPSWTILAAALLVIAGAVTATGLPKASSNAER
ncbi:MAG: DMT family transporter [Dongiaceae bacterium]